MNTGLVTTVTYHKPRTVSGRGACGACPGLSGLKTTRAVCSRFLNSPIIDRTGGRRGGAPRRPFLRSKYRAQPEKGRRDGPPYPGRKGLCHHPRKRHPAVGAGAFAQAQALDRPARAYSRDTGGVQRTFGHAHRRGRRFAGPRADRRMEQVADVLGRGESALTCAPRMRRHSSSGLGRWEIAELW